MIPSQIFHKTPSFSSLDQALNTLETVQLKASYLLGKRIEQQKNPLSKRLHALAIPAICLVGELVKIVLDSKRLFQVSLRSIQALSWKGGNARIGVTHACEHLRNIAGVLTGLFIGLYNPLKARQLFLTPKAETNLQTKLTPQTAATLYAVAYGVSRFFEKHGIDYRICHGSLLGAFRHKGLIPWDDDMDLMIHPDSIPRCRELFESGAFTRETGLEAREQPWTGGWQCFDPSSPKGVGPLQETGIPFLDVFRTKFDSSGENIVHDSLMMTTFFSEERIEKEEWAQEKSYDFGPLKLLGMKNAKEYLSRRYGSEVLDFAFQVLHHDFLAHLVNRPLDIIGHVRKIWDYDLPRRTFLEDRSPVVYDKNFFEEQKAAIDLHLYQNKSDN